MGFLSRYIGFMLLIQHVFGSLMFPNCFIGCLCVAACPFTSAHSTNRFYQLICSIYSFIRPPIGKEGALTFLTNEFDTCTGNSTINDVSGSKLPDITRINGPLGTSEVRMWNDDMHITSIVTTKPSALLLALGILKRVEV
jgi:hypothetical protein